MENRHQDLIRRAKEARELAYAPFSGFQVGAALECRDGSVYTGCNVENASYSVTICAERAALARAVSDGRRDFVRIAVISNREEFCYPCGTCRQALFEFSSGLEVLACSSDGSFEVSRLDLLLPHGFRL